MGIPISKIMDLPVFQNNNIRLIAGQSGLNKTVHRATVIEIPREKIDPDENLEGSFVLTTFGFFKGKENVIALKDYFIVLANVNISGILLKINRAFSEAPDEIIKLADEYSIPLFVLDDITVYFREIIYAIVAEISNYQYDLFKSINEQHELLYNALLSGRTIESFIKVVGENLHLNCACLASDGKVLAEYDTTSESDKKSEASIFNECVNEKLFLTNNQYLTRSNTQISDLTIFPCFVRNRISGFFVTQKNDPLTEREIMFSQQMVSFLSIRLLEQRLLLEKKYHMTTAVIDELLFCRQEDESVMRVHLQQIGFVSDDQYCVISIQSKESMDNENQRGLLAKLEFLSQHIGMATPGSVVHLLSDGIILIISLPEEPYHQLIKKVRQKIRNVLQTTEFQGQVYAGISLIRSRLNDLSRAYYEAKQAINFGKSFSPGSDIYCYNDLPEAWSADYIRNTVEHDYIVNNIIKPIQDYDENCKAALWVTLGKCIINDTLENAAKDLHIHIGTLRYRLLKITELTNEDYFTDTGKYFLRTAYALSLRESDNKLIVQNGSYEKY